jgi:FHS family glucose/mannose:H+ symporter-like MFS transporter
MYNKKLVFWSACTGMFIFGIGLITLGSVAPDLRQKLNLDDLSSGTLFSILPFGILAGSLLFGPVVDRYGYRFLMIVSCFLMSLGFEGVAFTSNAGILKICILLIGLGGGIINGSTNAMVADISEKNKSANLSLLGVFFGIGALGMPLVLGILKSRLAYDSIVATTGILILIAAIFYIFVHFPPAKQIHASPFKSIRAFLKDRILILIAFFLFFQSSFEGIINNWTTTYLIGHFSVQQNMALYGLSLFVAGMAVMRFISGTFFINIPVRKILIASFFLIFLGLVTIKSGSSIYPALTGLVLLGAGLAGGFPIMLGFVGELYAELSGTAFSFVLIFGLTGNMLINYMMGIISQKYGIKHLMTVAFAESLVLIFLCIIILKNLKKNK